MKRIIQLALVATIVILAGSQAFAADKAKSDKEILLGNWTVAEGIYADNTVETEMEMGFVIKATTMSNPMDQSEMAYSIDEKTKTISSKTDKTSMKITYRVVNANTVEFTEMTVTTSKSTQIVGSKGTFKLLKLKRTK